MSQNIRNTVSFGDQKFVVESKPSLARTAASLACNHGDVLKGRLPEAMNGAINESIMSLMSVLTPAGDSPCADVLLSASAKATELLSRHVPALRASGAEAVARCAAIAVASLVEEQGTLDYARINLIIALVCKALLAAGPRRTSASSPAWATLDAKMRIASTAEGVLELLNELCPCDCLAPLLAQPDAAAGTPMKVAAVPDATPTPDFAHACSSGCEHVVCDECKKPATSMKRCARCKSARYCSMECQRRAWPAHKTSCAAPAK